MNIRNIITARSVLDTPESLPLNFNMAAVGVMKNGMSKSLFSSSGNTAVFGQPGAGKTNLMVEFISSVVGNNKKEK